MVKSTNCSMNRTVSLNSLTGEEAEEVMRDMVMGI